MSRLSFKSFCIEYYAEHAGMSGTAVYRIFKENGLLSMLDTDYEDLHGMSWEYLMRLFDEYIGRRAI
jgi:AraC-like DNA-binding protein